MRRVVAISLVAALILSAFFSLSPSRQTTVYAADAPNLRRIGPGTITAGSPTFTLRVEGKGFADGAKILLDGVPLASTRVTNKGKVALAEIDASVVASVGAHSIQLINPDGQATPTETLTVVARDPDQFIRLEGNAAQEASGFAFLIGITGRDFDENTEVRVFGFRVTTTVVNDRKLTFELPPKYTDHPARVPIMVRDRKGNLSNVEIFFVVPRIAKLNSIDPESVEVGTEDFELKISGNFKPDAVITVNGVALPTTMEKDGDLVATVPASFRAAPAQLIVRVEQEGSLSLPEILTVTPTAGPFIYTISPLRFRVGETKSTIDIVGANFNDKVTALLDGQEAKIRDTSRRRITIVVPSDLFSAPGTHTVQIQDKDGNLTGIVTFEVAPDVVVSTLAGDNRDGFNEGCVSADDAMFRRPRRLALSQDRLLYVTDQQNHAIRRINTVTGEVCTVAGTGLPGYNDSGNPAQNPPTFSNPNGIAVEGSTLYVTENGNNVVRRIRTSGSSLLVDTFAGLNVAINDRDKQKRLNSTREGEDGFRDGIALDAQFRQPDDILVAPDGTIYVADPLNHAIRIIRRSGDSATVETLAGNGVPGYADGTTATARFNLPTAMAISLDGRFLFVADTNNNVIRRIDLVGNRVDTFAGSGSTGGDDGPAGEATFDGPIGLAMDLNGVLYVTEFGGNQVRRVDAAGNVSTLAGSATNKFRDGTGIEAKFNHPRGLAIDVQRRILYVADYENHRVREIALQ